MYTTLSRPAALSVALLLAVLSAQAVSTDSCANIVDQELVIPVNGYNIPLGTLNACLCIAGITNFEETDTYAEVAVYVYGEEVTTEVLTNMIVSEGQTCTYPDHAEPTCLPSNPCAFGCIDGFTVPSSGPADCVCQAPNTVCDGACKDPSLCAAPPPTPSGTIASRTYGRTSIERRANRKCESQGLVACGVFGMKNWECVDTARDLESCGGCTLPFDTNPATGVDCTALPGVLDVACEAGSCVVKRCLPGYELLPSDTSRCSPSTVHTITGILKQNSNQ